LKKKKEKKKKRGASLRSWFAKNQASLYSQASNLVEREA
jgi:hypothetical protein